VTAARKPWLAALLSLLVPGLGHLYAGKAKTAVFVAVTAQAASWLTLTFSVLMPPSKVTATLFVLVPIGTLLAIILHAGVTARRADPAYELRPYNRWSGYLAAVAVLLPWHLTMYSLARKTVAEAFRIPSPTMEPVLLVGDYVLVAKLPHSLVRPEHEAIVVFRSVEASTPGLNIVKRVIGTSGDTLQMAHDTVYRNGKRLSEPYKAPASASTDDDPSMLQQIRAWQLPHYVGPDVSRYRPTTHHWGPIVVPSGYCFVMGDNRDESYDSRYYGFVPVANIRGRPRLIYFSHDSQFGTIRWRRIGQPVH